ncbi:hypothetical protein OESDEN_24364 [Oesophagostomum dentatum]|uniref:Uncharacterized protein n=1 Tax=Oesophagostomum dentatum TaxID=61180 RepID=A0A0B1RXU1_OESDE|nr:hypothetical protein OESDEN_24364 [Oesophagostomum dentatum]
MFSVSRKKPRISSPTMANSSSHTSLDLGSLFSFQQ